MNLNQKIEGNYVLDINEGFNIDKPDIFVKWNIAEKELQNQFQGHELKRVTTGYYTANCLSLSGLDCMIGFHFEPRKNGMLKELEFFRMNYSNQQKSFNDFQLHFEKAYGKPTRKTKGNEGFNSYEWSLRKIQIVHYVFDRFGPEEHMRIKCNK